MAVRPIAVVVSGFPRRSETFALNELSALERAGVLGPLFATKSGDGLEAQPGCERLLQRVEVLPAGPPSAQAEVVANRARASRARAIHGYFAHAPAEIAERAAEHVGVPFGFSVHARDARKVEPSELARRARSAACVIACNPDVVAELGTSGASAQLIPHGVDLARFSARSEPRATDLHLLAVGRLVEKKGFATLIAALAMLEVPARLRIIGEGPELVHLQQLIGAYGLAERVTLCGSLTHAELPAEYEAAHVVVVPSIVDQSGDRDGLPNVVLEAMASARPVVASDVAAIGTAVVDGETGLLVPPANAAALAQALRELANRPGLRERLGMAARRRVEAEFELGRCTHRFLEALQTAYA